MAVSPLQDPPLDTAPNARVVITKVFVRGLKIEAEVGVYSHERGKTQPLVIDIELDVAAAGARHLTDTLNYETIRNDARALGASGHIELVEVFAERLASALPSTAQVASGSTTTRLAGSPTSSGRPWSSRPTMAAGFSLITVATPRQSSRPGATMVATTTDSAVCNPSIPGRATENSQHFSCSACGA